MEGSARRRPRDAVGSTVLALGAAGLLLRLALDALFGTNGDLVRMDRVGGWLATQPLDVYVLQRPHGLGLEWPYLPGCLPIMLAAHELAGALGLRFEVLERLPVIAANVALVWLVDAELRRAGRGASDRVTAAALLSFAPLLVLESAWHGQLDLIATLAATAAIVVWERVPGGRRALLAGALLGVAGAAKTPLGVLVLALAPLAHNRGELVRLVGAAGGVLVAVSLPYLIRDPGALAFGAASYHGLPGVAGLNLVVQPDLAQRWLTGAPIAASHASKVLESGAVVLQALALAGAVTVIAVTRPRPAIAAVLVLLAGYAAAADLATHYAVWIVPFLLLCGWTRISVTLQVALLVPLGMLYVPSIAGTLATPASPWSPAWADFVYVPWAIAAWLASVLGALLLTRQSWRSHRSAMVTHAA